MLGVLLVLVQDLFLILFAPYVLWRRSRACPRGAFLRLEIDRSLVEIAPAAPPWALGPRPLSLEALRRLAATTAADPRVAGWLVEVRSLPPGLARTTALRRIFAGLRAAGKRVIVYLPEGAGTRGTFLAVAADRVLVGPQAHVAPLGFAVESHYLAAPLEAVGIEAEVFAQGRYKSFGERLVSRTMSEPQREQLEAVLASTHEEVVASLAEGRGVSRERAARWIDEGPFPARRAVAEGLVDAEAYPDEVEHSLEIQGDAPAVLVPARTYGCRRQRGLKWPGRRPCIAVLELRGPIVPSSPGPSWPGLPVATEADFVAAAARLRENRRVRGVVLRVDSPGGSVLVSDRMLHAVRRLAAQKPVVACLGDVAASGGYLVALGAHSIVAEATTLTGSIGVVAARFSAGALLERLGVTVEVVKRGERADMGSLSRKLSASEREALGRELADVYDDFVGEVARSRKLAPEVARSHAEGRVHSGRAALERGLVDELGGFPSAVAALRSRLGPGAEGLAVVAPRRRRGLSELLGTLPAPGALAGAEWSALWFALGGDTEGLWAYRGLTLVDRGRG